MYTRCRKLDEQYKGPKGRENLTEHIESKDYGSGSNMKQSQEISREYLNVD